MTGYWHIPAIAMTASVIAVILDQIWPALFLLGWLVYLYWKKRLRPIVGFVTLILFLIMLIHAPHIQPSEEISSIKTDMPLSGTIKSQIDRTKDKVEFVLETKTGALINVAYFPNEDIAKHDEVFNEWHHGASCDINADTKRPAASTNPGEFDYRDYLANKQIHHQIVLNSPDDIDCSGASRLSSIYQLRTALQNHVEASMVPETTAWLKALVFGETAGIDPEYIELFQRWSLSHLLAISGLHVGLVVGFLYAFLIKGSIVTKSKAQWIIMTFLPLYALLAGGEPSVWRASLMAMVVIIMNKLRTRASMSDSLSVIFIALILHDPFIIYHVGFQLSFLVTMGLLLSGKWLSQTTHSPLLSLLKISLVSQLIILPLQIHYFHLFNPLSILLSALIVPYFTLFVIPFMFILLISTYILDVSSILSRLFGGIHQLAMDLISWIDDVAYFPMTIGEMPIWAIALYYIALVWLMIDLENGRSVQAFKRGTGLVIILLMVLLKPYISPVGSVTMLDIGQGDAAVVELPHRKGVILIDAGGKFSFTEQEATDKTYQQVIEPFLLSKGIAKVDAIFLSHSDLDHNGSADAVIDHFNVDTVFLSDYYPIEEASRKLWQQSGANVVRVGRSSRIKIGGHDFTILSPDRDWGSPNENSLVIYTTFGKRDWLFMGDADMQVEHDILKYDANLTADVLKTGHHGSRTSTDPEFIKAIRPRYALISAGRFNRYGHPAEDVLKTLEANRVNIFRTDQNGAVTYEFTQDKGTFFKYRHNVD